MSKEKKKFEITSLEADILTVVAIIVGIGGILFFSKMKENTNALFISIIILLISIIILFWGFRRVKVLVWVMRNKEMRKSFFGIYQQKTFPLKNFVHIMILIFIQVLLLTIATILF